MPTPYDQARVDATALATAAARGDWDELWDLGERVNAGDNVRETLWVLAEFVVGALQATPRGVDAVLADLAVAVAERCE